MFRFAQPDILYALALIPLMGIVYLWYLSWQKKATARFGDTTIVQSLMPGKSKYRGWIKFMLIMFAFGLLVFGLAGPQFGSKLQEVKRDGVEIIIALDVSNSMLAEDIQPNRLERSKQAISRMVDRLKNDRIGLIVFAGDAFVQLPLTSDYVSAKMFLSTIHPGIMPVQGTAIGSAIRLATSSFSQAPESSKVIIVITDGENHEDDPVVAAQAAADKGILVHTLGMGLPGGAPVPLQGTGAQKQFLRDQDGNVVVSKLDERTLQRVAEAGIGAYIRATNSRAGLDLLFNEIDKMEKTELEAKVYSEYEDQYQLVVFGALLIMFLDALIMRRRNKYLKNLKLFQPQN
jgi:Ca-activated chloride channel homolog